MGKWLCLSDLKMQSHSHNFICKPSCHLIFSNSLKLAETFHLLSRAFAAGGCLFATLGCAQWRALCFTFVSDKRGRWQLYRDQVSSPALVFMCVGMDAKENTAELHCGSSCRTCSRAGVSKPGATWATSPSPSLQWNLCLDSKQLASQEIPSESPPYPVWKVRLSPVEIC